ncbi:putative DNA binding protein 15 [Elsinoe australis]|uniref:Putative DNA binding protein 15 n=1 Tax=Elsinoe australis TaxID=40998 RepID=A0A4U7ASF4_9PEZI|nr:putative DNA binding protein 15 [Elsinoe australis]
MKTKQTARKSTGGMAPRKSLAVTMPLSLLEELVQLAEDEGAQQVLSKIKCFTAKNNSAPWTLKYESSTTEEQDAESLADDTNAIDQATPSESKGEQAKGKKRKMKE